jgi:hypothetical protein
LGRKQKRVDAKTAQNSYTLEIPLRLPLLNKWERMHWALKGRTKQQFAWALKVHLSKIKGALGALPLQHCEIDIYRHSSKDPDNDGLIAKPVLDAMVTLHPKTRPYGIGIIENDDPEHVLRCDVHHRPCKPGQSKTVITITKRE